LTQPQAARGRHLADALCQGRPERSDVHSQLLLRLSNETGLVWSVPDLRHPARPGPVGIGVSVADQVECGEVLLVGIREGVEVLLRGRDLGVAHPVHDGLEIGSACQQPGWVSIAQVVDADVKSRSRTRRRPVATPGCGGCCERSGAVAGREEQVTGLETSVSDVGLKLRDQPRGMPMVRGSLSLGRAW
jgi:hypothetical protein